MARDIKTQKEDERGQRLNDQQLHAHCLGWVRWCATRKYYLRPAAQNILARMHPTKTGEEPNIRNDPEMAYFNMAVHALADMPDHAEGWACFRLMYIEQADHIKRQADKLGISRPTYYARARAFARHALSFSHSLKRTQSLSHTGKDEPAQVD